MSENLQSIQPTETDAEAALAAIWGRPPGIRGLIMAVNNQPIGKRYMVTSLVFFSIAGVLSLVLRAQLTMPQAELVGPDAFNAIFTMHGSTMMYLFAVPFVEGLALYLVPLMIGSRDVAFPRLTNLGYWLYLFGGLMMYASFIAGHVPDAGWFAYTPLSGPTYSGIGLDFWLLGLGLVEIAGLGAALEIVVTILKMRAPGMAIHRMPLIVWSFLVAGVMILFGFTPLLLATLLLEMDRSFGTQFFNPEAGGSSLLWQHLFWFFGHPEVYIIFLPATGVVSTVVPAFARRPIVGYTLIVAALVIIGFVSFGLWVHHMFTTGLPVVSMLFFVAASFMVAIGSAVQIYAWIATLWGSRPRYGTPLLYILGFLFIFIIGGITGVMVAALPFDWQVHDTYFIVAHFHYVLIGGAVFPIFAGLHFWLPKITGRLPAEPWAKLAFWLVFIGFNVTFFPMHMMGFFGMPRRTYTYAADLGLAGYNIAATVGAAMLAVGFALALGNLVISARRGPESGPSPWNAGTLEWTIPSPPPAYSFAQPPVVRTREPAHESEGTANAEHQRIAEKLRLRPQRWRGSLITTVVDAEPQAVQALPGPTSLPFVVALALVATAAAVLIKSYILAAVAGVVVIGAISRWMWRGLELPEYESDELAESLGLPVRTHGRHSTTWWGMIGFLCILATALGALLFTYFYLRLYSEQWPQQDLPLPSRGWHSAAIGCLAISALAQAGASWRRRHHPHRAQPAFITPVIAGAGLGYLVLLGIAMISSGYDPTQNAYTSAYTVLGGFAMLAAAIGVALHIGADLRLRQKLRGAAAPMLAHEVCELFWYFVIVTGLLVYTAISLSPHVL